jgi:hypothetical protein
MIFATPLSLHLSQLYGAVETVTRLNFAKKIYLDPHHPKSMEATPNVYFNAQLDAG